MSQLMLVLMPAFVVAIAISAPMFLIARRQAEAKDKGRGPLVCLRGDDVESLRVIYQEKYANFRHFDLLRWGLLTSVFTAAGLVTGYAGSDRATPNTVNGLVLGLGAFTLFCWWAVYRITFNLMRNQEVIKSAGALLGDNSIPRNTGFTSAIFVFMVATLGIALTALSLVVATSQGWDGAALTHP